MNLYLVQHGEAKSSEMDPERPLTEAGVRQVEKSAAFLRSHGISVSTLWHSGKTRASQTADILGPAVSAKLVQRSGLSPKDPVEPVAAELEKMEKDLMVVGHLPFLNNLASELIAGNASADTIAFKQGGVLRLARDEEDIWRVDWMVVPDLLT